ncbi:hypothetical protein FGB62_9g03 [Gracilaria domingensis]|nr:hypothetical protein FGB62_9g03 [Gracilaria domingensis]
MELHRYRSNPIFPPPRGFNSKQPGWIDTRGANQRSGLTQEGLICYSCYGGHHLASDCTLSAKALYRIVMNYEALTEAERAKVPGQSYWKAKDYVGADAIHRSQTPTPQVEAVQTTPSGGERNAAVAKQNSHSRN